MSDNLEAIDDALVLANEGVQDLSVAALGTLTIFVHEEEMRLWLVEAFLQKDWPLESTSLQCHLTRRMNWPCALVEPDTM